MRNNVVPLRRPRTFTSAEAMIEQLQELLLVDGRSYKQIAELSNVGTSTIGNIATGKTRWPRHTTLFPLMVALGYHIQIGRD